MGVDSIVQRLGDTVFPIDDTAIATTLVPLDPGKAILLGLFKAAINYEFGPAWAKIQGQLANTLPVHDTLELEPSHKVMLERRCKFPLLCVYRRGEHTLDQKTLFRDQLTCHWGVDYVLGPLSVGDVRRVGDICQAIVKLVRLVIRQRGHKSYDNGALQFFHDKGGFAEINIRSYQFGQAAFAGDEDRTMYYALSMDLETTEIGYDDETEWPSFEAFDLELGVGSSTDIAPGLIYASSDVPVQNG